MQNFDEVKQWILSMGNFFLAAFIIGYTSSLSAQDSVKVAMPPAYMQVNTDVHKTPLYVLYSHTSPSVNSIFNEDLKPGVNNRIDIDFDYYANSNSVPASFGYDMLFQNPISNALKDRTDNRIKNTLKFEDYMKTGVSYRRHFKKWDGTLILGYHYRQMLNLSGPKQAYETIFYGNARFDGDTANLSNINFQLHNYNQYSIGISKKMDYGKYQMQLGISGSFLQGINNQNIHTGNSWLYTAPDGEYLGLNYDLNYNTAHEGSVSFFALNGTGASADFNLAFMNKDKWKISLDISDLGAMSFQRTPVNYTGSKYVEFHGIAIPDLTSFSSQTFDTLNIDSAVRSNLPSKTNNAYSVFLPFTAQLIFSKPLLNNRLVISVGAQYRHLPGYYVYGFAKVNYFMKHEMVISATAGAGGYSVFNLGFEFSKTWKYFDLTLGSSNLIGLFVPSYYAGTGLYLRLATSF